ncbi:acylphosphatase [Roseimaritima ulvae]|nr:acylphosphatase [Roseimaritima ulvae]
MSEKIRVKAIYNGTVQGVGFRATTAMLAENAGVTGTVRNLPDGSVELVAEGWPGDVDAYLDRIAEQLRHRIDTVDLRRGPATDEFDRFRIAY